eukprot:scaffold289304_cov22-Tisochrysis_lutea.AAC.1
MPWLWQASLACSGLLGRGCIAAGLNHLARDWSLSRDLEGHTKHKPFSVRIELVQAARVTK